MATNYFNFSLPTNNRAFQNQSQQLGLGDRDLGIFLDLASVFDRVANKTNATYWLYGGTLMGYARYVNVENMKKSTNSKVFFIYVVRL